MSPKKFNSIPALTFAAAALLAVAGCNAAPSAPPPRAAAPTTYGNGANGPVQLPPRPPGSAPLPKCEEGTMGDCTK
ncbi:MAG TPA: hypothetical protein VGG57_04660 [Stellaceae bacterium]|jgi:hypothetical protein